MIQILLVIFYFHTTEYWFYLILTTERSSPKIGTWEGRGAVGYDSTTVPPTRTTLICAPYLKCVLAVQVQYSTRWQQVRTHNIRNLADIYLLVVVLLRMWDSRRWSTEMTNTYLCGHTWKSGVARLATVFPQNLSKVVAKQVRGVDCEGWRPIQKHWRSRCFLQ